ncbi:MULTISPECIES: hypothetical protein [unclassified Streptomyces]|uniref:hypothetical protein n=1 Tax=unclassified Streptomyces TaxID=2593676 RepID=UPI002E2301ED|nr:hypothetical protein OG217_06915 [Streptomyces sp. NBC_01023]
MLDALSTGLTGPRRILTVDALTTAAADAELGRYVRDRLRNWAESSSQKKIDLTIDVCGGPWGLQRPALALTRWGKAAGGTPFGDANPVGAFEELARRDPTMVHKNLVQWLQNDEAESDGNPRRRTLGSFLALVSSDVGSDVVHAACQDVRSRERFVHAWQSLLSINESAEGVLRQLTR